MVQQAVEDGAGDYSVAEHLAPGTETLIAGDDDCAALWSIWTNGFTIV
jgi:hypothetical protein